MIQFSVNEKAAKFDDDPSTPLLWVLRDSLGLTGTKYGCGIARCGACTVHLNGSPVRACVTPVSRAEGGVVRTIEGLSSDLTHPVQEAWLQLQVPQCGYCHAGQMMTASALISKIPNPTDADIDDAMSGNLCRCGTYHRIRAAVHLASELARKAGAR
jgi:aerobic-type carbon monoxide dehydrogenase small subunit (CoxS/CutS family)